MELQAAPFTGLRQAWDFAGGYGMGNRRKPILTHYKWKKDSNDILKDKSSFLF